MSFGHPQAKPTESEVRRPAVCRQRLRYVNSHLERAGHVILRVICLALVRWGRQSGGGLGARDWMLNHAEKRDGGSGSHLSDWRLCES